MDVTQKLLERAKRPNSIPLDSPDADLVRDLVNELENVMHKLEIAEKKYDLEHTRAAGWFESYTHQHDQKTELLALIDRVRGLLSEENASRDEDLREIRRLALQDISDSLSATSVANTTGAIAVPPELP